MAALPFKVEIMHDGSCILIPRNMPETEGQPEERYRFSSVAALRSWASCNIWLLNSVEKGIDLFKRRPAKIRAHEKQDFQKGGIWRERFPRLDPDQIVRLFVRYGRLLERRKARQGECGETR